MRSRLNRRALLRGTAAAAAALAFPAALSSAARAAAPERLVVAGGAITEMVYRLGAEKSLVGVDTTSLYPNDTFKLPKIGYFRQLSAEGILSLNPSLLLVTDQAGPPAALERLRAIRLPLTVIPETLHVADVPEKMRLVGAALDRKAEGERQASLIRAEIEAVNAALARLTARPRVLFLMSITDGRLLAGGDITAAESMIRFAGGRNAVVGSTGYKPISAEAAFAADPDYILLSDQSLEALGGIEAMRKLPQLGGLKALRENRVVTLDMLYLLALGPRVAHAGRDLAAALHPGATLPRFA